MDGFRLDVVNVYFKDAQLPDNPPRFTLNPLTIEMRWQKRIYDCDQPELFAHRSLKTRVTSKNWVGS